MQNKVYVQAGARVVFTAPRQVVLEPQEAGTPGPGEALLRTDCTLISTGTELTALTGDFPPVSKWADYIRYPCGVGYSNVGTVLETGEGVSNVQVGEQVVSMAPHATFALFPADRLWPVPDGVETEAVAFAVLAEIVMGGVRRSRLTFGESAVIIGAGLLGQLTARVCRAAGAWPVIVIDPAEDRLHSLSGGNGMEAVALPAGEAGSEIERLTGGRMADVVFEVTGHPGAIPGALKLARPLGRVVILGSPRGPIPIDFHNEVHSRGLEVIGAHNSTHPAVETPHAPWTIDHHVRLFLEWQRAGILDVRPLVTHRYPARRAAEAYAMLLEDRSRALGVILNWREECGSDK